MKIRRFIGRLFLLTTLSGTLFISAVFAQSAHEIHMTHLKHIGCYDGITELPAPYVALCETINSSDGVLASLNGAKQRTATIETNLKKIKSVFEKSIQVESDLKNINDAVGTLSTLISIAEAIPSVSEEASQFKDILSKAKEPVSKAKDTFATFNTKMSPAYKAIIALDTCADDIIKAEEKFLTLISGYLSIDTTAYKCVVKDKIAHEALDNSTTYAKERLETLNNDLIKAISGYDQAIKQIDIVTYLEKELSKFNPIEGIEKDIAAIESNLSDIEKKLHDLEKIINRTVEYKIPYGLGTYKLKFKVKTIIQGLNHVEKEIENLLSSVVYDAAKEIGLGNIFKDLKKDADKIMGNALKELHLNISLNIPDLSKLEKLEQTEARQIEEKFNQALQQMDILKKYFSLTGLDISGLSYPDNQMSYVYQKINYYEKEAKKYECKQ